MFRLAEILKERNIRGTELAQRLGVTPSYVNQACKGTVNLSLKKCQEIADALGVSIGELFDENVGKNTCYCPHCGKPIILSKG